MDVAVHMTFYMPTFLFTDCINMLLVGSGDLRHLLNTLAQASSHTSKPIHVCCGYLHSRGLPESLIIFFWFLQFYIIESCLEVLARHMLFLALLMESPDAFGLQGTLNCHRCPQCTKYNWLLEKAEMFMELYGNSLIRAHTAEYLKAKATDLIK